MADDKLYYKLARTIIKAGAMPIPIGTALIELLQAIINEDQAEFIIKTFKKPSLNQECMTDLLMATLRL